ncbi:MAG: sigma-70 family RNA polymerase sigma factor [Myxococcota bacterium]
MDPDAERFEALLRPVRDGLMRFALQLTRDPVRAEDLMQQSLTIGLSRLSQLQAERAFRAWMSRIVWTTFINDRQRAARTVLSIERPDEDVASGRPGPDQRLMNQRLADRIARALGGLPEPQARAVWLVDAQGFKYREAASILDLPLGTVATLVARGRRILQHQLRDVALEQGVVQ